MQKSYLALDLGGTKLLIGEVAADGTIISSKSYPTGPIDQQRAAEVIFASVDDFMATEGIKNPDGVAAIGIGLVGRIDSPAGLWCQIDSLRTEPLPLAKMVSERYGLPCYIDNDVKCATRAEQLFGIGRSTRDFIYINIGTGIAAGVVTDGRLIRGSHHNAGEVGHTSSGIHLGIECICERRDCTELISAGVGFDACARLLAPAYPETELKLPTEGRVDVREVVALAERGDALCTLLINNAAQAAADLIMNLVRMSDPEAVVLGGGIVSNDYIWNKIIALLGAHTMRFVTLGTTRTSLDARHIGLIGAAAVAMQQSE